MICTESDIIPHLQDKTTLREERNSSWDRTSQPEDKARDAKTFQNQFRMVVAAIIFEFLLNITLFVSCTNEHITRSSTVHGTWGWPGTMSDKLAMNQNLEQKLRKQWVRISTLPQTLNLFFWREFGVKRQKSCIFWKSQDPRGGSNVEIRYPQKPKIWEKWNKYVVEKRMALPVF